MAARQSRDNPKESTLGPRSHGHGKARVETSVWAKLADRVLDRIDGGLGLGVRLVGLRYLKTPTLRVYGFPSPIAGGDFIHGDGT